VAGSGGAASVGDGVGVAGWGLGVAVGSSTWAVAVGAGVVGIGSDVTLGCVLTLAATAVVSASVGTTAVVPTSVAGLHPANASNAINRIKGIHRIMNGLHAPYYR
jgi:hypothetical protein